LPERVALARKVRFDTFVAAAAANVVGAAVVGVYLLALSPGDLPSDFHVWESIGILAVYLLLAIPIGDVLSARPTRAAQARMERGLPLSREQRAALVAIPWRAAVLTFVGWTGAAALFTGIYALRYGDPASQVARFGLTIALGGLTTSALVFLLNEGPLRPVYELAFAEEPPTRAEGMRVRRRLVLAWVLGAGLPLLGVALGFLGTDRHDYSTIVRGMLTLVPIGLVAGAVITLRVARSVAGPLDGLRGALDRVRRGHLDTHVPIDDVTEIGLLQAGFNEMVSGLRERAQLEDLFGRHVGVDVAREAVEGGVALGGEQRELSALFVDLVGSTRLAATRAPEEVVALLNDVFEAVVDAASQEGGWVNKFEGDAALCVFGAPAHDDRHAERALRSARGLREALDRLAERHPGLDAGIGVSAGVAVAGNVGAEARFEYTVIGDPVNEAARLTEAAKARPGRVLASGDAIERAGEEAAHWREAATLELRGRPEPTVAWEPISRASASGSVPSGAS
jgi:adenylate cyclase